MKKTLFPALAAALVLAACGTKTTGQAEVAAEAAAQQVVSSDIAYVQVEAVLAQCDLYKNEGVALQEKTEKAQKSWAQREQNLQAEAAQLQQKYEKGLITSRDAQAQQESIQKKVASYQSNAQKEAQTLDEENYVFTNRAQDLLHRAVQEINADYQSQIDTTRANLTYDKLEMSGSRAVWPEVLAVYAVKTTTDPDDPQEVATVDDSKKVILKDIFWQMNDLSSRTESKTEDVITETDDGHGNIVETVTTVTRTYLYITVSHKTAEEMAEQFDFTADQRQQLSELLAEENRKLWSSVLYGIYSGDDAIVTVALSQVGNIGGGPYWSWYGFGSRVEWCACFVSWCADQCGYIDTGVCPKFSGCGNGVQWFQERGRWLDGSAKPVPGMVIFFDWDNKGGSGPQDGEADHVGIVQKVEDGIIYTVEGNSGNLCRVNRYPIGHYEILGYGVLCP